MGSIRRVDSEVVALFAVISFLTCGATGPALAGDKKLTELEIAKMELGTKDMVIDLIDAGVLRKNSNEFRLYMRYAPNATVRVAVWDDTRRMFTDQFTEISGAEYRRAFIASIASNNSHRLDREGQDRIIREIFGQATIPERGSEAFNRGATRIRNDTRIVLAEAHARPAESKAPPTRNTPQSRLDLDREVERVMTQLEGRGEEPRANVTGKLDSRIMAQVSSLGNTLQDPALWESSEPTGPRPGTRQTRKAGVAA